MRSHRTWISILILLAIWLHAVPVILDRGKRQILWPFLVWSMYKDSRPPGPIVGWKTQVIAVTATGARESVTPYLVGLSRTALGGLYLHPWRKGDTTAAGRLIVRLNRERKDPIVELRLERERYLVSDSGLVRSEPVVTSYRPNGSESR